jgi:hypothetical protein
MAAITYESVSELVNQLSLDDKHSLFKMLQSQHGEDTTLPHHFKHKCEICRSLGKPPQCAGCFGGCDPIPLDSYECMICLNGFKICNEYNCNDSSKCKDQAFAILDYDDNCPGDFDHFVCMECALQSGEKYIRCTECEASLENPLYQSKIKSAN